MIGFNGLIIYLDLNKLAGPEQTYFLFYCAILLEF